MFLHHLVPSYSRSQTIFASTKSAIEGIELNDSVPIATVAHEFSEVPFYLHRNDIQNYTSRDKLPLVDFVQNHRSTLLVVDRDMRIDELRELMPPETRLQSLGDRGPARLFRTSRENDRVAKLGTGSVNSR